MFSPLIIEVERGVPFLERHVARRPTHHPAAPNTRLCPGERPAPAGPGARHTAVEELVQNYLRQTMENGVSVCAKGSSLPVPVPVPVQAKTGPS